MFKIGEKVVCIDDSPAKQKELIGIIKPLVLNEIYTIRSFVNTKVGQGVILSEIINPVIRFLDGRGEPCYDPARFRKLDYDFADNLLAQIKEEVMCNI